MRDWDEPRDAANTFECALMLIFVNYKTFNIICMEILVYIEF